MVRYYCNVCKDDITKGEFQYSIDKFGKPLCRIHQDEFRNKELKEAPEKTKEEKTSEKEDRHEDKGTLSKASQGIVKASSTIAESTRKVMETSSCKLDILRRMETNHLYQLAKEKGVRFKSNDFEVMVKTLKRKVKLDYIIAFCERNQFEIQDILDLHDKRKAKRELKRMDKEGFDKSLFFNVKKEIMKFEPLMPNYPNELPFHVDLARYLKNVFPDLKVEVRKGSSRPDIVIESIAIEVKGPTGSRELDSVSTKCFKYPQHFDQGLIVVLFKIKGVTTNYLNEWKKGLTDKFPRIEVIKKI